MRLSNEESVDARTLHLWQEGGCVRLKNRGHEGHATVPECSTPNVKIVSACKALRTLRAFLVSAGSAVPR